MKQRYVEIVAGLVRRDPVAASALHDAFAQRVNRLVWRMMGADQEHDDVVQQAFLNVVSSIHTLRAPEALEGWVVGVVVNTVRREIRKRKLRRMVHLVAEVPERPCGRFDPEQRVFLKRVYEVIDQIPIDDRIAFSLHYFEGQTLAETAAACGCSLATAKRRIARARDAFKKKAEGAPELTRILEGSDE